jgi:hypothetical protein
MWSMLAAKHQVKHHFPRKSLQAHPSNYLLCSIGDHGQFMQHALTVTAHPDVRSDNRTADDAACACIFLNQYMTKKFDDFG